MPDAKPAGLSDEEWGAIQAHRQDSAPKRKGTLRGTDDSGAQFEIELTVEETAKLAAKHLKGLFVDDKPAEDGDPAAKPTALKDYFGGARRKAAGS